MKEGPDVGFLSGSGCKLALVRRRPIFYYLDTTTMFPACLKGHLLVYVCQAASYDPLCVLLPVEPFCFGSLAARSD
jgi:hypothetical protein